MKRIALLAIGLILMSAHAGSTQDLPAPQRLDLETIGGNSGPLVPYLKLIWIPPEIPSAPRIENPRANNSGSCTLPNGNVGNSFRMTLDYRDLDGDVISGAKIRVLSEPSVFGAQVTLNDNSVIPGGNGFSGTLDFEVCIFFGDEDSVELTLSILDAAGNSGNYVRLEMPKPATGNGAGTFSSRIQNLVMNGSQMFSSEDSSSLELLSYNIYRRDTDNEESFTLIANVPAQDTTFIDELTNPGTAYRYRVTAVYNAGESLPIEQPNFSPNKSDNELFDRTLEAGGQSIGSSWGDMDGDNDLDLFVANDFGQKSFLYKNNGDGTLTKIEMPDKGHSHSGSWGDYDNDGDLDLFVANFNNEDNFLYRNNGAGTFVKMTSAEAGLIVDDKGFSNSGSWSDYDNDGDLDLFVANGLNQDNFLYRNNGPPNYRFTKMTHAEVGSIVADKGRSNCGIWGDYNNDGDLDLFVANFEQSFLYRNNGNGTFTKMTSAEVGPLANDKGQSVGGSWGDYDNDRDLDLFVANERGTNFLYKNSGPPLYTFTKITTGDIVTESGHSFGSSWGDFDNDGDLDLLVTHTNKNNSLYENKGDDNFDRIDEGNIANNARLSSGVTWADYDNDGFLDIFIANRSRASSQGKNFFYLNNRQQKNNSNKWINIRCIGTVSNKSAIGAKVRVKDTINSKPVWQMREISAQTGWGGQNGLNAGFGLGIATETIDSLVIEWPSRLIQVETNLKVNQFLTRTEPDTTTGVGDRMLTGLPTAYALHPNYPNPFNPATTLSYDLPEKASVNLAVYNLFGQKLWTLVDKEQPPGFYSILWNGLDDAGIQVTSGIYLYRIHATGSASKPFVVTNKMLLIK